MNCHPIYNQLAPSKLKWEPKALTRGWWPPPDMTNRVKDRVLVFQRIGFLNDFMMKWEKIRLQNSLVILNLTGMDKIEHNWSGQNKTEQDWIWTNETTLLVSTLEKAEIAARAALKNNFALTDSGIQNILK